MCDNREANDAPSKAARMVRCTRTQRYWNGSGWTGNCQEATTFGNEMDAVRACVEHNLRDIELVLRQPGTSFDLFATQIR